MTTAIRASRTISATSRLTPYVVRSFVTTRPALAAVTASIGKTKSVDGPEVSSYPAPKHLKVPSGLTPQQIKTVSECLNSRIADAFALFVKTKNYHWHVSGSHFREYHLLFDDLATSVFNSIDTLAERVRRIGGTTIRSVSQISTLQNISDDNRDSYITPADMIKALIDDNYGVLNRQRAAYETCEENKDFPTANILEELMDETERRIWFLKMTSEGGTHQN